MKIPSKEPLLKTRDIIITIKNLDRISNPQIFEHRLEVKESYNAVNRSAKGKKTFRTRLNGFSTKILVANGTLTPG